MEPKNYPPALLPPPGKPRSLVQTKLTSAFFRPVTITTTTSTPTTTTATSRISPYFVRPSGRSTTTTTTSAAATSSDDIVNDDAAAGDGGGSLPRTTPAHDVPSSPSPTKINLFTERRRRGASLRQAAPPPLPSTTTSNLLSLVATETKLLLPSLLSSAPHAPPTGHLFHPDNLPPLSRHTCPQLPPTNIEVINADSIDAALSLSHTLSTSTSTSTSSPPSNLPPILILNMANAHHGGGGWLKGALAQEESLCYRSSLSFTLKRRFYPLPDKAAIYSPSVLVLRQSIAAGHTLLDLTRPRDLPVISVVSVAAVRDPAVEEEEGGQGASGRYRYAGTRALMKEKMRVVLRVAASTGHRVLVLGALGCGAFGNPRGEVVACWGEVLAEEEFRGGWWEKVVFAVMEEGGKRDGEGNFGVFWRGLHGVEV